ncbi:SDR family NAD(P)-dependent oxidoreductase [Streptomyces antnestii]|uniref:SDR family NAD(P)-dependent oxidoreductase n=1 Tax=Streptomyces antnestii TaxID=2494256 RepID=UPI001CB96261|nr:SDR family NAD(P)-dependent oxidoreductase [Streptomyces sp. San01]
MVTGSGKGAPAITAPGVGSIVTIGSVTATTGSPLTGHYAAAKAAVDLTRVLHARPKGMTE